MNYTSIEQSKKLLELGLSANTADMYYYKFADGTIAVDEEPYVGDPNPGYPCWSFGTLLEIMPLIKEDNLVLRKNHEDRTFVLQNDAYCTSRCKSPINAAYEMMIWLLENKEVLTTEELHESGI